MVVTLSDKTIINFKRNYYGLLKIGPNRGAGLFLGWSQSGFLLYILIVKFSFETNTPPPPPKKKKQKKTKKTAQLLRLIFSGDKKVSSLINGHFD